MGGPPRPAMSWSQAIRRLTSPIRRHHFPLVSPGQDRDRRFARLTWPHPRHRFGRVAAHVAVLVSGSGTNLQSLLDHPVTGPWIAVVVADRPGIAALDRARAAGVPAVVVDWSEHPDREAFGRAIHEVLLEHSIEYVALA